MIKYLIFLILFLPLTAHAQSSQEVSFDYTGVTAQDQSIDNGPQWVAGNSIEVWPSAQAGELGIAQQFTISAPTSISMLDTSTIVYSPSGGTLSTSLTWSIYQSTDNNLFPSLNSPLIQSSPVTYTANELIPTDTVMDELAFNVDLQPGTYWIAEQGTGDAPVSPSQEYIDPPTSQNMGSVATPEIPSWIFFIFIGLFIAWKTRGQYVNNLRHL